MPSIFVKKIWERAYILLLVYLVQKTVTASVPLSTAVDQATIIPVENPVVRPQSRCDETKVSSKKGQRVPKY